MSADDNDHDELEDTDDVRDRIEQEADRAVEQFDEECRLAGEGPRHGTRARNYATWTAARAVRGDAEGTGRYPALSARPWPRSPRRRS